MICILKYNLKGVFPLHINDVKQFKKNLDEVYSKSTYHTK